MLIRLAIRNLLRNPRRTVAVLLTIAMGTGSLFLFHGFNAGIMNQYRDNTIHARFGHGQVNTRGYRDQVFERPREHWIADWKSVGSRLGRVPGVEFLFPRLGFAALLTNGRVTLSGRGEAIEGPAESHFFTTLNVIEGKALAGEPDGILIGRGLAHALDVHHGDKLAVVVQDEDGGINRVELKVVGVFHTGLREIDDTLFRIPLAQGQKLLGTDRGRRGVRGRPGGRGAGGAARGARAASVSGGGACGPARLCAVGSRVGSRVRRAARGGRAWRGAWCGCWGARGGAVPRGALAVLVLVRGRVAGPRGSSRVVVGRARRGRLVAAAGGPVWRVGVRARVPVGGAAGVARGWRGWAGVGDGGTRPPEDWIFDQPTVGFWPISDPDGS